ncbi:MAG: histone deacetylase family protein, partial [Gammaproteobacteria bacterium]|nr:histone deacetylase family protein [Gammaproteobacteria bacterium]
MSERLLWITHPACRLHEMGRWHPESPLRLAAIEARLEQGELWRRFTPLQAPEASREALLAVHAREHVDFVLQAQPGDGLLRI